MDPNASKTEEVKKLGWGSSLPVPSVQEMVRKDSVTVPERYIQEPKNGPQDSSFCEASSEVPIINFSILANGAEDERKRLDFACREWGFFQMIDHGVEAEALQKMKAAVAAFFDLPLEEKKKYAIADIQGYGQLFVFSEQQNLDWCDLLFLKMLPEKNKQLQYWPLVISGFREAIECHSMEMCKLNEVVLANLSVLMGMEKDGLRNLHGDITQSIRMNYYPPCSRPDVVLGLSPHSDGSTITYVVQDEEISGLQIRHNGGWIPVKPIPNAIVVNVGDSLEVWSNGLYKSIEHRAVTNEKRSRLSIATFMSPNGEAEIGPVETTVDNLRRPRMYKTIKFDDYRKLRHSNRLNGKANIDLLKL